MKNVLTLIKQQVVEMLRSNIGKIVMKLCIALMLCAGFIGGCSYLNKKVGLPDDNLIEEAIENKLEDATGLNLDLSPDSPE